MIAPRNIGIDDLTGQQALALINVQQQLKQSHPTTYETNVAVFIDKLRNEMSRENISAGRAFARLFHGLAKDGKAIDTVCPCGCTRAAWLAAALVEV